MSEQVKPSSSPSLIFTDAAAEKVNSLIEEENNPSLNLRVSVKGGGCSGYKYGFKFTEKVEEDDIVIMKEVVSSSKVTEVRLLIDPMSFIYLKGAEIDYREDINGTQFVIRNPNAKTTCGCGSSFST